MELKRFIKKIKEFTEQCKSQNTRYIISPIDSLDEDVANEFRFEGTLFPQFTEFGTFAFFAYKFTITFSFNDFLGPPMFVFDQKVSHPNVSAFSPFMLCYYRKEDYFNYDSLSKVMSDVIKIIESPIISGNHVLNEAALMQYNTDRSEYYKQLYRQGSL